MLRYPKLVLLNGHPWWVRDDGYRFWVKPAEGNPLLDREERCCIEYKHFDFPANDLAHAMFDSLPSAVEFTGASDSAKEQQEMNDAGEQR